MFNEFQTERDPGTRFVAPKTLYDVFVNIRDDEGEHVATMHAMQVTGRRWWAGVREGGRMAGTQVEDQAGGCLS